MPLPTFDLRAFDVHEIRIASPCSARWDEMTGDDRTRHCEQCQLDVFDTAYLSANELAALLARKLGGQRVCLKIWRRADGTAILSDCPVGLRRWRLRMAVALGAVVWGVVGFVRHGADAVFGSTPTRPPKRTYSPRPQPAVTEWEFDASNASHNTCTIGDK